MKSMRRVSRGRSFLGLMTYLLRRDAEHRQQPGVPIGGTVCGTTARDIARELRSAAQQRPDIIKPVWHQALRLPQGERLPPLTWCRIAEVFMEEMGFDTAQQPYAVVLHDDPQGQHIHIAASRVGMDGRIYLGQNENLRASRLMIELEKRFGLQRTPGPDAHVNQPADPRAGNRACGSAPVKPCRERSCRTGSTPCLPTALSLWTTSRNGWRLAA